MGVLADELRRLQARRGIRGDHPERLVGPHLARMVGLTGAESPTEVRRMVIATLRELSRDLPQDLRLAFLAGLGVHPDADAPVLGRRLEWVARELYTSARTARRYLDQAVEHVESEAVTPVPGPGYVPPGWWLAGLRTTLRLGAHGVESFEEREIVATVDDLEQVVVSAHLPRAEPGDETPQELELELVSGACSVTRERPTPTYFRHHVRLPRPLALGERHVFTVSLRVPSQQGFTPRYVFRPLRRCDRFSLVVRFTDQPPPRAWRVPGVPHGAVDDLPRDPLVPIDGGYSTDFTALRPGLAYGLRWG
ncbi:hypothetical protein GCM10007079_40400 [Nocardiopsis terrae]|uniref:Uncharacterized protein n=1 Tax=Nocardiopsis terrae TaxID=372655 RepID=A0ABR9HEH3_9ACTN|nr:hypothetical protein [Nocardiopsis terrae]MBE1457426.1 hypothetical protein [Nocardiopsis terrae]GHC92127.1 hypothetical protein GCM10007079_40400 [Nocardiopsis terrae]